MLDFDQKDWLRHKVCSSVPCSYKSVHVDFSDANINLFL